MSETGEQPTRRSFIGSAAGLAAAAGVGVAAGVGIGRPGESPQVQSPPLEPLDPKRAGLPYLQNDPRWGKDLMWDRSVVLDVAKQREGFTSAEASALMRQFPDGNNIANEGCQLTCLAMVLRLLDPTHRPNWTPGTLNEAAHEGLYYTLSGLSVSTLYADIISDLTDGLIQLTGKEESPSGNTGWPETRTSNSPLAKAYLSLSQAQRAGCMVMLKTGTWDDTVASHYVLIDPLTDSNPAEDNPEILDPAMPADHSGPWRLTDSAEWITQDSEIKAEWDRNGINPLQISGVWAFSLFDIKSGESLSVPLLAAWAQQAANRSQRR